MKNQVAIVKCKEYNLGLVYRRIREAIDYLGGISSFVKVGETVLIKPNILVGKSPEHCVGTHPMVVEAVAKLVLDAGAKVILGDSPGIGTTKTNAKRAGYGEVARKLDFEIVEFNHPTKFNNPDGKVYKSFEVDETIKKVDKVINLPKLKTHGMMYITLAVKNLFGAVVGTNKVQWHFVAGRDYSVFARFLVELYYFINPVLNILDAVIGMEGNGPQSGHPKEVGLILASKDGLSLDRIASEVVRFNPNDIPVFQAARELGFNSQELENIMLLGERIDDVKVSDFSPPRKTTTTFVNAPKFMIKLLDKLLTIHPKIRHSSCTRCRICTQICPAKAVNICRYKRPKGQYMGKMIIDYERCIRCFCCQEMCPNNAITIRESTTISFLNKLTRLF